MSIIACSFNGCEKPSIAKSLCRSHYMQVRRGVELRPLGRTALTTEQRFWQKVDKTDGCWHWTGSRTGAGYGNFHVSKKNALAHRFSFELSGKRLKAGFVLDHICHNAACVNPSHLVQVTQKQNTENLAGAHRDNPSGIRGVSRTKNGQRWQSSVSHAGIPYYLGTFASKGDAGEAARLKRLDLFTNNPLDR